MRKAYFLLIFIAILPTSAIASIEMCRKIKTDLERLECYDNLEKASSSTARKAKPEKPPAQKINLDHWHVSSDTSDFTDKKSVYASVQSNEVIDCGWSGGAKISMLLRCSENTTSLLFNTACHMTSSRYTSYGDVQFRVDKKTTFKRGLQNSTDNKALGLWSGGKSIPVIKRMLGGKRLVVQMTPFNESPFTASFNIAGIEEVTKPLRETCGW